MSEDVCTIRAADASGLRLLEQYLGRRRTEIAALDRALEAGDYEGIRRIGHNLRGSGDAYEIPRISSIGERLEEAAERGDKTSLAHSIRDLERVVQRIIVRGP